MGASGDYEPGAYLTDGTDLFQVLRTWAPTGQVMIENCGRPEEPALIKSVAELAADGLEVVRTGIVR